MTLNLKSMLQHHIDYRRDVITRRTRYELARAQDRAHILEGLKICIDNIDRVIKIIRGADDETNAQRNLEKELKLSERQSKAIVDMRLGRLTKLEAGKIAAEYKEVIERIAYLEDILANPRKVLQLIKDDLDRAEAEVRRRAPHHDRVGRLHRLRRGVADHHRGRRRHRSPTAATSSGSQRAPTSRRSAAARA